MKNIFFQSFIIEHGNCEIMTILRNQVVVFYFFSIGWVPLSE